MMVASHRAWRSVVLILLCLRIRNDLKALSISPAGDQPKKRVVIIGAGVGGLATAARLLASSTSERIDLHILEQNSFSGGRCGSFWHQNGEYRHERGPSLLLLPDVYEALFQDVAGVSAQDFGLRIEQCVPGYQAVFEDGDTIQLGFPEHSTSPKIVQLKADARRKLNAWESNGASKWDKYISICRAYLDAGFPNFIEERLDLSSLPRFIQVCFQDSGQAWPLKPHSDVLDSIFESSKLQALASFQNLYVGLEPYKNNELLFGGVLSSTAPAVFGLLSAIEFHNGVYAPIGGFSAVTESLERLAVSCGSTLHFEKTVTSVQPDGVNYVDKETNTNHYLPADLVIVNADLPYAENSLLGNNSTESHFDWNDRYRFSSGVIAFHWSVNKRLDRLCTHNVFLAADNRTIAEKSWRVLRENKSQVEGSPFNFYVHCASRTDPSASPSNGDAVLVLVPCPTLHRNKKLADLPRDEALQAYADEFGPQVIARIKNSVLQRLQAIVQFSDEDIIEETIDTPASYASAYNLGAGTPFGISHGFSQLSLFRPAPKNTLHVGASTRPGNGVPLVLVGALRIAEEARKRLLGRR